MQIAISGAGVAGPTFAYWLLRNGHEPTLIEAAATLRTGGYMLDFWGLGYTIANRMGIAPQLHEAGYAVQEVRFLGGEGRTVGGFSTNALRQVMNDQFVSLPRGDLAAAIYGTIAGKAETIFETTIENIEQSEHQVHLSFDRGPDRRFDLLIGADGLHSNVRRLIFGPHSEFQRQIGYVAAAFEVEHYRPRDELAYVSYGVAGRQISRFALRGDRTLFLLVFAADRLSEPIPREISQRKAILHRVFAGVGWEWSRICEALDLAKDIYFDNVSQIVMNVWAKGRVALLGDAAACVSLLAGEGSGLAMVEAYVLAGELELSNGEHRRAFASYEARMRPFVEAKQASARRFASSFAPRTRLGIIMRNQVMRLMAIPWVAKTLLAGALRDDLELPEYRT